MIAYHLTLSIASGKWQEAISVDRATLGENLPGVPSSGPEAV
jgi:hypothetical protein